MTPDVNVLVAAFRPDHSHHEPARTWLSQARHACAQGSEPLTLLPMVVVGFLRLVTNPRVFTEPDAVADAVAFIDAVLESPGVELSARADEWPLLRGKLLSLALRGNGIPDAWIASAVETVSEHLVSFDRDFRRLLPAHSFTLLGSGDR